MRQFGDESTGAMRRGELPAAQSLAERGLALAQSQRSPLWEWTFRLLRAESLVLQSKPTDAVADLTEPLPAAGDFDSLRARQQLLYAKAQAADGQLQKALNIVEHGRRMASSHDVHFDLDEFAAQLRLRLGQRAEGEALLRAMVGEAADVGDRFHQALALNDIGMGRIVSHRYEEAAPMVRARLVADRSRAVHNLQSVAHERRQLLHYVWVTSIGLLHCSAGLSESRSSIRRREA